MPKFRSRSKSIQQGIRRGFASLVSIPGYMISANAGNTVYTLAEDFANLIPDYSRTSNGVTGSASRIIGSAYTTRPSRARAYGPVMHRVGRSYHKFR